MDCSSKNPNFFQIWMRKVSEAVNQAIQIVQMGYQEQKGLASFLLGHSFVVPQITNKRGTEGFIFVERCPDIVRMSGGLL
ncbi:hypothetical protein HAT2_00710 [Candidatus Similichlamydia laticola]|uniref:Uncharacterized protein n=1 Tax=Candidatus Similichlamydia laticola TaxID=2170265 RepID=A0A369KCP7_9BACT|nr:hypothetical protein HAT2_00710 [Candidatus Similichlamydia laticola]